VIKKRWEKAIGSWRYSMSTTNFYIQDSFQILSNLGFIFPALLCLRLRKIPFAFLLFTITIVSTLYHACKFGAVDLTDRPEGVCFILNMREYFMMDHMFASLSVPCFFIFLTTLDMQIFQVEKKRPLSINNSDINDNSPIKTEITTLQKIQTLMTDPNVYHIKKIAKSDRQLELTLILLYALVLTIAIVKSYPGAKLTANLVGSSVLTFFLLSVYRKSTYGDHITFLPRFKLNIFIPGVFFTILACILIVIQDFLPAYSYRSFHPLWHVVAAIAMYCILASKKRVVLVETIHRSF